MMERISFPFSHTTGIHYVSSFSICPFIFRCLEMSERACVSSPAVTARVCTDGRQEGRTVYCFRPCGVPAVTDGLGPRFSSGLCVSQSLRVQSVRSLAATSNHTLISLDQKQEAFSQYQHKDSSEP